METKVSANKPLHVQSLTRMALCLSTLIVASYIRIPMPASLPAFTAQTLAVNLIALILTPKQVLATLGTFLAAGCIGLPVFGPIGAGPSVLFGPYGGYYFGFLIGGFLISLFKGKEAHFPRYALVSILAGIPLIELCGMAFMMAVNGMELRAAFIAAVLPYLLPDTLKCILASLAAVPLNKALNRR